MATAVEVEELSSTERGEGGFGSTGVAVSSALSAAENDSVKRIKTSCI
jgi:hypothetical protein